MKGRDKNVTDWIARPILIYDITMNSREQNILQRAYIAIYDSKSLDLTEILLSQFTLVYGPSIKHPVLRYAVCAFRSRWEYDSQSIQEYVCRSQDALQTRLRQTVDLDEGDLFSLYFLACIYKFIDRDRFIAHLNGFVRLLTHFASQCNGCRFSHLRAFWVLVADDFIHSDFFFHSQFHRQLVYNLCLALYEVIEPESMKDPFNYMEQFSDLPCASELLLRRALRREHLMLREALENRFQNETQSQPYDKFCAPVALHRTDEEWMYIIQRLDSDFRKVLTTYQHDNRLREENARRCLDCLFYVHLSRIFHTMLKSPHVEDSFVSPKSASALELFHRHILTVECSLDLSELWNTLIKRLIQGSGEQKCGSIALLECM